MAGLSLRPLARGDAEALGAPALLDVSHGGGANAVVAVRDGRVVGGAGWVETKPTVFAWPVIGAEREIVVALLAHVVAVARQQGASRVRVGADPHQAERLAAIAAAGFTKAFDFIDHTRPVGPDEGAIVELPYQRVAHGSLDAARMNEVYNETFAGVPNAPPMTVEATVETLAAPETDRAATSAWAGADGRYVAFVIVVTGEGYAEIDSIGVREALRGKRVAAAIIGDVLARVRGRFPELRARIASTNASSRALHARMGFVERSRRAIYELSL